MQVMQQPSAKQNEASNKDTMLRRKKTMSIIIYHLYIRSKGLCDLKTLYYHLSNRTNMEACCRICIKIVRKIQSIYVV